MSRIKGPKSYYKLPSLYKKMGYENLEENFIKIMNISEFERSKPKQTFKSINFAIEKYQSYIREIDPIMDEADAASMEAFTKKF